MSKRLARIALVACLVAGAFVMNAEGRLSSGIRGNVLYGPTCPVEQVGQSCVKPYDATLRIRRKSTRKIVATVRSGDDGRFTVRLRPGRYVVEPVSGDPYPHAPSQEVLVNAHRFAHVTIMFDSGIR